MDSSFDSIKIKKEYEDYLGKIFLKNLTLILSISIVILCYYIYSDWSVRHNLLAIEVRIPPLVLIITLLIIHLLAPQKLYRLKHILYLSIYLTLQLMMYGKCLVHLHEEALAPSVTGTILILFLISLDNKENTMITAIIYAVPILLYTLLLILIGKPSSKEFLVMADVYPIVFLGYTVNRIHNKLRFKLFVTNHLLNFEKEKTKDLYEETLQINEELKRSATEAIVIKEEIQEKNEELNISNATKDKFLRIIAHDLKNPIHAIWGSSDLLLKKDNISPEKHREYLVSINKTIKHTYQLLENLLNWAMAQNKSILYNPVLLDASKVVENELKMLRELADKKAITIENNIPTTFNVYADLSMFETIIRNLVSNAIKYTFNKGHIQINARMINEGRKDYSEIVVSDDGVGMTGEKTAKLFKITKNISTKGTQKEEGTGLGLLLCKEFVEIHKGTIEVESAPDKGSVFKVILPFIPTKLKDSV